MKTINWAWTRREEPELIRDTYPLVIAQCVFLLPGELFLFRNTAEEADWTRRYPDPKKRKVARLAERFRSAGMKVEDSTENAQ